MPEFIKAAKSSDLAPGKGMCVEAGGKSIALFNVDGTYHAIDNTCLHRGGPLGEGDLSGTTVTCPWHGWQYDVTTGKTAMNPGVTLATYETRVEGDDILVGV